LIEVSRQNGYKEGVSVGYTNLASVYEKAEKYQEALELKKKGLQLDREAGDVYGMMTSYMAISSTWLRMKRYDEALNALNRATGLCDSSWIVDLSGIENGYYRIYKELGAYPEAIRHYEKYNSLMERINRQESEKKVSELLIRFETETKEQQIKLLEQKNLLNEQKIRSQRLWILVMLLVFLILILVTSWWIRFKNQALGRMKAELHHFLLSQNKNPGATSTGHLQNGNRIHQPASPQKHKSTSEYLEWGLTPRESEILYYLGQGCTNAHIASLLNVSENTVKFHIKNIYLKLDVKNRIQALIRCNENNNHLGE
jgi:DNA-binding CsgD family transcriptional regulator